MPKNASRNYLIRQAPDMDQVPTSAHLPLFQKQVRNPEHLNSANFTICAGTQTMRSK